MFEENEQVKILELKSRLDIIEDTDPLYMNENLRYLRHKVLFIHNRLEASLDYLIIRGLTNHLMHKTTDLENRFTNKKMQKILKELSFSKKLDLVKNLFQLKGALFNKVKVVNTLRNKMAHAINNEDKIILLKKPENYIGALKSILEVMGDMDKLFEQFLVKRKNLTESI